MCFLSTFTVVAFTNFYISSLYSTFTGAFPQQPHSLACQASLSHHSVINSCILGSNPAVLWIFGVTGQVDDRNTGKATVLIQTLCKFLILMLTRAL